MTINKKIMGLILCIVLTLGQDICVSAAEDTTMLTEEKCAIETVPFFRYPHL